MVACQQGAGGVPLRRRNVCPARPCMLGRCARGAAASQSVDNSEQYVSTVLVGGHGSYARSPWLRGWEFGNGRKHVARPAANHSFTHQAGAFVSSSDVEP
jgi:hypothetical protein